MMPGQATTSSTTLKTPVGNATVAIWAYADSSTRTFNVEDVKFAKGALSSLPTKTILDTGSAQIAGTLSGSKISSQSDTTLNGHPGRLVTFATAKIAVQCEFFIVGDDVYFAQLSHAVGENDDALAQAFFATFQLTA